MKLLVCDDDISTIDVIQSQLNWQQLGISELLRAYNGEMAKQIIDNEKPDLILCDIGMPITDGIEVLRYVAEKKYDIEFSFLTCYEEFEYAKIAIQYGVTRYLTKPLELDEVKTCIQEMVARVKSKKAVKPSRTQVQYEAILSLVFRQACDGVLGRNKDMVDASLGYHKVDFDASSYWRIVFSCSDITEAIIKTWSKEMLIFTLEKAHNEALMDYVGSGYTVVNTDDRFIWSICFVRGNQPDEEMYQRCQNLIGFCEDNYSLRPVIIISNPFQFYQVSDIVKDLYSKIRKVRYSAGAIMFQNQDISQYIGQRNKLKQDQVLWYLKKRDFEGYHEYIRILIDKLNNDPEELINFRKNLINIFIVYFNDNGFSTNTVFMDEGLMKLDDKSEKDKSGLLAYCDALFQLQQDKLHKKYESENVMARAIKYVNDNYRENIDREDVAAVAFVTPNYLSKLFKNKMGINLREYINQLRIEEAKRLLLSTTMSVSEIASYVGYLNISYFSTVFHKMVGSSPYYWRNEKEENKQ
ncbi:MAG: response regulator transcription factor [Erysipelotrichaceae bacterium]|jgi:two-component system response regulator YesN